MFLKLFGHRGVFAILHVSCSVVWMFNGNFNAKWAIRRPSNNVAAILEEATATATSDLARTVAKINDVRNDIFKFFWCISPNCNTQRCMMLWMFWKEMENIEQSNCCSPWNHHLPLSWWYFDRYHRVIDANTVDNRLCQWSSLPLILF